MLTLKNKTIIITGASSGIGKSCAEKLGALGARLILIARREDKLNALSETLKTKYKCESVILPIDITDTNKVIEQLSKLDESFQKIDILINNAGLAIGLDKIQDGKITDWEQMYATNVLGALTLTKSVIENMIKYNEGHIVNICSIASHEIYQGGAVYCSTKSALLTLTKSLKLDLHGTNIRVTAIDPGMVKTEFSEVRFNNDLKKAEDIYAGMTPLSADDVTDTIIYSITRPPHVNISEIILIPTDQSSVSLVNKKQGVQVNG